MQKQMLRSMKKKSISFTTELQKSNAKFPLHFRALAMVGYIDELEMISVSDILKDVSLNNTMMVSFLNNFYKCCHDDGLFKKSIDEIS